MSYFYKKKYWSKLFLVSPKKYSLLKEKAKNMSEDHFFHLIKKLIK